MQTGNQVGRNAAVDRGPRVPQLWVPSARMSAADKAIVVDWIAADMPEGDPADAQPLEDPEPRSPGGLGAHPLGRALHA